MQWRLSTVLRRDDAAHLVSSSLVIHPISEVPSGGLARPAIDTAVSSRLPLGLLGERRLLLGTGHPWRWSASCTDPPQVPFHATPIGAFCSRGNCASKPRVLETDRRDLGVPRSWADLFLFDGSPRLLTSMMRLPARNDVEATSEGPGRHRTPRPPGILFPLFATRPAPWPRESQDRAARACLGAAGRTPAAAAHLEPTSTLARL